MAATTLPASGLQALAPLLGAQGGLSEVQLSVLASLELARRLPKSSDTELARAAREYCIHAWDVVQRTGRMVTRFAQSAHQVGQRVLPDLSTELEHEADAEAPDLGRRLGEMGVVVRELAEDGEAICHRCSGLRQDSLDLIGRVRSLVDDGSRAAIAAGFEDVTFAYGDAAAALSGRPAPVSIGRIWTQESLAELLRRPAGSTKEPWLLKLSGAAAEGAPDVAGALMQLAQAEVAPAEEVDREVVLAELLRELRWLHEQLAGTSSFWEDTWGSVRRLSLRQDHLETLLRHPGTLGNRVLRERSMALFDDYQGKWGSLVQECRTPMIAS